jgi:hypothetical protein
MHSTFFNQLAARWLRESRHVIYLGVSRDGKLNAWNAAAPVRFGRTAVELQDLDLGVLVQGSDEGLLASTDEESERAPARLVHFVGTRGEPFTLSCRVFPEDGGRHIVGVDPPGDWQRMEKELFGLNQELAVASREATRQGRELAAAKQKLQETLDELQNSYWHLKKVQEVIPVCMHCKRIRGTDASWDALVDYLSQNAIFVSHGLCPDCLMEHYPENMP